MAFGLVITSALLQSFSVHLTQRAACVSPEHWYITTLYNTIQLILLTDKLSQSSYTNKIKLSNHTLVIQMQHLT